MLEEPEFIESPMLRDDGVERVDEDNDLDFDDFAMNQLNFKEDELEGKSRTDLNFKLQLVENRDPQCLEILVNKKR